MIRTTGVSQVLHAARAALQVLGGSLLLLPVLALHTIEGFCSFDVGRLKVDRSAYLVVYHLNADHLKGTTCNLSSVFEERLRYDSLTPITCQVTPGNL